MKYFLFIILIGLAMFTTNANQPVFPIEITQAGLNNPIKVEYTNYRGEKEVRTIIPMSFFFGSTEYHPQEQWLLRVWDCDRHAERIYALKEISRWFAE